MSSAQTPHCRNPDRQPHQRACWWLPDPVKGCVAGRPRGSRVVRNHAAGPVPIPAGDAALRLDPRPAASAILRRGGH